MFKLVAFRYAWNGLSYFLRHERHAPIHLIASLIVICLGAFWGLSQPEWFAVLLCVAMVIGTEILNSAVERLTDMISPQYSESAKVVKDLGAAAVLVVSTFAATIGLLIFAPKFINLLPL